MAHLRTMARKYGLAGASRAASTASTVGRVRAPGTQRGLGRLWLFSYTATRRRRRRHPHGRDEQQRRDVRRRDDAVGHRRRHAAGHARLRRTPCEQLVAITGSGALFTNRVGGCTARFGWSTTTKGTCPARGVAERRGPRRLDRAAPPPSTVFTCAWSALRRRTLADLGTPLPRPSRRPFADRTLGPCADRRPRRSSTRLGTRSTTSTRRRPRSLVSRCRAQLAESGACELPGFLTPTAVRTLAPRPTTSSRSRTAAASRARATSTSPTRPTPTGIRAGSWARTRSRAVAYDLFPPDSGIRALYEWDGLRAFVAAALDKATLYPYADPLGALNLAVMEADDELAWHFDQTDFVVSLALVPAEQGGDFEYAPRLRGADNERYDDVAVGAARGHDAGPAPADDTRDAAALRGPLLAAPRHPDRGASRSPRRRSSRTTRSRGRRAASCCASSATAAPSDTLTIPGGRGADR